MRPLGLGLVLVAADEVMKWIALIAVAACGGTAAPVAPPARPSPQPRDPTPASDSVTETPPDAPPAIAFCGGDDTTLSFDGVNVVVCSNNTCVGYREGEDGTFEAKAPPPDVIAWPAVIGHDLINACAVDVPDRCRMVGPKARGSITTGDFENPIEPVTKDLAAAAIEGRIWDLARDRAIVIHAPGKINRVDSAGNAFVVGFETKADPACNTAVIVDQKGVQRGAPFAGLQFIAVDDQRLVVSPYCDHTLTVHDLTTGAIVGRVELPEGAVGGFLARIDAHTVATLWGHSDDRTPWQLAWVHLPDGQPPALGKTITIPSCRRP
jgi:hypothetical protein